MATPSNRFNDIFHDLGDDNDEPADEYVDFDNPNRNMNIEDDIPIVEEQHLSQKLSQLSTETEQQQQQQDQPLTQTKKRPQSLQSPSTPTATLTTTTKKIKPENIETGQQEKLNKDIPKCLSLNHPIFERMIQPFFENTATTVQLEGLRQFALLKHKLFFIDLHISLWTTYLCSGTGRIINQEQEISTCPSLTIWPEDVKLTMIDKKETPAKNPNEINDESCLNYVHKILREFRDERIDYQTQLEEKKQQLNDSLTLEIEQAIDKFVEQHDIALHRLRIEGKILQVQYEYKGQLIELEFYQENPSEYQIETFKKLIKSKYDKEKAKCEVAILKQRLAHNHLPDKFASIQIAPPVALATINNEKIRQRLLDRLEKVLQKTKSDMMMIYIMTAETKMNEYATKFNADLADMKEYQRQGAPHMKLTETISDDQELDLVHHRSKVINNKSIIGCAPNIVQDAIHYLSSKQLAFLQRGPTYVPPCLIHVSSPSLTLDHILTEQMEPLQQQLTKLFEEYEVDKVRRWNFETEIQQQFIRSFSIPIPSVLEERISYEKQVIQSIRYQLKHDHLILRRTANETNTYYLGQWDEFHYMAQDYMDNSTCYELITIIDENNSEQDQLNEMIQSINFTLEQLLQNRLINADHLTKMQIADRTNVQLPYLYFLPETHQDGHISLQPRFFSSDHCPIQPLATYLDQLLRPLFDRFSQSTRFHNGTDFIQKLQHYCIQEDNLLPLTKFVTFQIHHLHTRVAHTDLLTALKQFLRHRTVEGHYERFRSETIEKLTLLVLQNHIFTYNGKIYRHTKGSPSNLPFTELLFNIYLHDWQLPLVRQMRLADGFYGRYHNIGLLTWYGSTDKLIACINGLNEEHPDIQLTISMGSHVHFLNAYLENQKGHLYTRVYHDPFQQPFLLPYVTGHPRLMHRKWFRFALLRASQYCSSLEDFNEERLYIELTFLANGYSLDFVEYHLQQLFERFNLTENRFSLDRWTYPSFRTRLFYYLNEQKDHLKEQQQFIELNYLFDWGSRCEFNQKFYKLWSSILNEDPVFKKYGLQIKLNSKHCFSSNSLFNSINLDRITM